MMKKLIIIFILLFVSPAFALQVLIKIPVKQNLKTDKAATVLATLEQVPAVAKLNLSGFHVTDDLLWNTRIYNGYKLINIVGDITLKDLEKRINRYRLDWTILACNDGLKDIEVEGETQKVINTLVYYDFNEVIVFIKRDRVYDFDGNFFTEIPPTKIEFGKFQGALDFESN